MTLRNIKSNLTTPSNIPDHDWDAADIPQRVTLITQALPNRKMDQTKLKKLLEVASPEDQIKLKVLHNAVVKCIRDYQADSTSAKLKDWKSAEGALDAFIDALWTEHFGDSGATLPNVLAIVEYLSARGWKVKKSAVYQHHKDKKIMPQKDGAFRIADVEKYATAFLKRLDGVKTDLLDTIQKEKSRAEADKLTAQAKHWKIKTEILQGRYVEKDAFELELARRAAVFRSDIENFIRAQAMGIISLVGGDDTKAPDLIDFMLDQAEGWLDRYSGEKEFTVPVLPAAVMTDDETGEDEEDGE